MAEADDRTGDGFLDHREGVPTGEHEPLTPEEQRGRDRRNLAIAGAVVAFILIVFLTTIIRVGQNLSAGAVG
jgi:hypothetical protein